MRRWIELAAALYPRWWREEYGEEFSALLGDVKPGWRVFANVLGGAIAMQITHGTGWLKLAGAAGIAGALIAGGASFAVAPNYVSSAAIEVAAAADPLRPASPEVLRQRAAERAADLELSGLHRAIVAETIQRLYLYPAERRRMPTEDILEKMRRDIRIEAIPTAAGGAGPIALSISFAYPDRWKAAAVVQTLVTAVTEENESDNRARASLYQAVWKGRAVPPPPLGAGVKVIDMPSVPSKAIAPNRAGFAAAGLAAGLLLGLLAGLAMRRRRGWLLLGGCAAAGCLVAWAGSLPIPDRYTSTAMVRITAPQLTEDPRATPTLVNAAGRFGHLQVLALSRESLAGMIRDPKLDIYPKERAKEPLEDVIEKVRRDIRIEAVAPPGGVPAAASAFRISFTYTDRQKAQAAAQWLVTAFVDLDWVESWGEVEHASDAVQGVYQHRGGRYVELLDPASFPELPVTPNRMNIAAAGLGIGLLAGAVWLGLRRPQAPGLRTA